MSVLRKSTGRSFQIVSTETRKLVQSRRTDFMLVFAYPHKVLKLQGRSCCSFRTFAQNWYKFGVFGSFLSEQLTVLSKKAGCYWHTLYCNWKLQLITTWKRANVSQQHPSRADTNVTKNGWKVSPSKCTQTHQQSNDLSYSLRVHHAPFSPCLYLWPCGSSLNANIDLKWCVNFSVNCEYIQHIIAMPLMR